MVGFLRARYPCTGICTGNPLAGRPAKLILTQWILTKKSNTRLSEKSNTRLSDPTVAGGEEEGLVALSLCLVHHTSELDWGCSRSVFLGITIPEFVPEICEDRIGMGPPLAKTEVIHMELSCWAIPSAARAARQILTKTPLWPGSRSW